MYTVFVIIKFRSYINSFICLEKHIQQLIMDDLILFDLTFNTYKISDFIKKIFCLVAIRNCIMHGNSLEILVRYYDIKNKDLRKRNDKEKYVKLINELCIEKTHE